MCCLLAVFALPVRQPAWGVGRVRVVRLTPTTTRGIFDDLGWLGRFPKGTGEEKECGRKQLHGIWLVYSGQGPKIGPLTKKHVLAGGWSGKQKVSLSWGPGLQGKSYQTLPNFA